MRIELGIRRRNKSAQWQKTNGRMNGIEMDFRWRLTSRNWSGWIPTIGASVCAPSTVKDIRSVTSKFPSPSSRAGNWHFTFIRRWLTFGPPPRQLTLETDLQPQLANQLFCLFVCLFVCLSVSSKPLTYAIALNELGSEVVHRYVGQEPSGRMFNELILDYNSKLIRLSVSHLV